MFAAIGSYLCAGDPAWAVRRRMAVATMLFCMLVVLLCLLTGAIEKELARTAISAAFTCLMAVPTMYSLAAVADDHSQRKTGQTPEARD
jgi:uncharacterized membrane protein